MLRNEEEEECFHKVRLPQALIDIHIQLVYKVN